MRYRQSLIAAACCLLRFQLPAACFASSYLLPASLPSACFLAA
jgi:hypothetical protein